MLSEESEGCGKQELVQNGKSQEEVVQDVVPGDQSQGREGLEGFVCRSVFDQTGLSSREG